MCTVRAPKPVTPAPPPPPPPVLDQAAPETAKNTDVATAKKVAMGNRKYRTSLGAAGNAGSNGLSIK